MEEQVVLTEKGTQLLFGLQNRAFSFQFMIYGCLFERMMIIYACLFFVELLEDGFGDHPFYHCVVAEVPKDKQSLEGKLTTTSVFLYQKITELHIFSLWIQYCWNFLQFIFLRHA